MDAQQHIALLEKKVLREKSARQAAERLLEGKSHELFLAKQLVEETLENLQEQADLDLGLLTLKTYLESILLDFNQLFLKSSISGELLQHLLNDLAHVAGINAVRIDINRGLRESDVYDGDAYSIKAGRVTSWNDIWEIQEQQEQDCKRIYQWSPDGLQIKLLINAEDGELGFLFFSLTIPPAWRLAISKQLSLFSEMISVAYQRDTLLHKTITEKQRAENSEKSTRDFVAMINHELRTPLNGLLGSAELMRDTEISNEQERLLNTIEQSGELLRVIINDLLDLSKMNAGMLELTHSDFSPAELVKMINDIFTIRAEEKSLAFKLHFSNNVPSTLLGDSDRIKQILVNLIGNSVKFTRQGSISLKVDWVDANLVFKVRDTGCGIPLEKQQTLFDPFVQVDNSSNRKHEGTGLGLSICRHLVDKMGGNLSLVSKLDQGSCFTVILPLPVVAKTAKSIDIIAEPEVALDSLKVLVVEDIKTNQLIIKMMLAKLGIVPEIRDNGLDAIEFLATTQVDIILMDCRMPIMDGFEATSTLRKQGYKKPILALTAGTTTVEVEECYSCGMDAIVNKPYQLTDIRAALITWSAN